MNEVTPQLAVSGGDLLPGLVHPGLLDPRCRGVAELEAMARAYDTHVFRGRRKIPGSGWLTERFIRRVHGDMFGDVWNWAGTYRSDNWTVGVEPHHIQEEIQMLCKDFHSWEVSSPSLPILEIGARLQNRFTRIHAFPHGNGRHACLMTDIFFRSQQHPTPRWPRFDALEEGDTLREQYILAMIRADEDYYEDLMKFIEQLL